MPRYTKQIAGSKQYAGEQLHRRMIVADLLLQGLTYRVMEEVMKQQGIPNCSIATISRDVAWLFEEWKKEAIKDTDSHRQLQLKRMELMLEGVWDEATEGNQGAIDAVLKIMDRQAKLLGLDRPKEVSHIFPDGMKLKGVSFLADEEDEEDQQEDSDEE